MIKPLVLNKNVIFSRKMAKFAENIDHNTATIRAGALSISDF
jgi:hypothetical protein